MDIAGKSDPYAFLYVKGEKDKKWVRLGRTATMQNNLNPAFDKIFEVNYLFERNQYLKVEVFDEDSGSDDDDLIGNFDCPLNKLLVAKDQTIKGDLVRGKPKSGAKEPQKDRGKIFMHASSV